MDRHAAAALSLIDGDVSIAIRPPNVSAGDPIACKSWDLGAPDVRITSTPNAGSDGTSESGGYLGARTVTLDLLIRGDGAGVAGGHDPYWYVQNLAAMCHPSRSPVLQITRQDETSSGNPWNLALRGSPWSVTWQRSSAAYIEMSLSFVAPLGFLESDDNIVTSTTVGVQATDWHFPAAFPHSFGHASSSPFLTAVVAGSAPVYPMLYINGPVSDPRLRDDKGNQFRFSGLTLAAGDTVRVDMGSGSVLKATSETSLTNPATDIFYAVDFDKSTFWQWQPGTHTVALLNKTGSFTIAWRDRQLMI